VHLDAALLDAVDAIVPPGTNVNAEDAGWQPSVLSRPKARRRSAR